MVDRFCSQCGAALLADANFCVECGRSLGRPRRSGGLSLSLPLGRFAPVAVVGLVVAIAGGAVVAGRYNPVAPPTVPGRGAPDVPSGSAPPPPAAGQMPANHPPIEIPDDVKRSIEDMRKQADAAPEDTALWLKLGGVQYRAGQIDPSFLPQADAAYRHVLERDPKNLEALRILGNIAFDRDQPEEAIAFYQQYLGVKPDDFDVQTDLATMTLAKGDVDAAIGLYDKVLAQKPDFFQAIFNLGIAYRTKGDMAKAAEYFKKSRALAPDDRTRAQADELIARLTGTPPAAAPAAVPAAAAPAAPGAGGNPFRAAVESIFRAHPMIGPKIVGVEWTNDTTARVLIRDFPMGQMPDDMKERFTDRMKGQIKEKKDANQVTAAVTVQLVDPATQTVMDTLVE